MNIALKKLALATLVTLSLPSVANASRTFPNLNKAVAYEGNQVSSALLYKAQQNERSWPALHKETAVERSFPNLNKSNNNEAVQPTVFGQA